MERKAVKATLYSDSVLELKKHVAVIHSSNKLTLLQRKIANALLFNAYKELQEKEEHTIHIAKLCELIGYDSNDYKSIKRALINLISTVLEWNLVDGERLNTEGVWNASSIIAGATIEGALCTYSYSMQMRKLLYKPHIYGRLDMQVQSKFKSTYGLALYENCNRFQDIGQTPWFSLAKFRKLMGVEDSKYKIFRDFKSRVLDKAIDEVNKYSSLAITVQVRKENRQVAAIQFLIEKAENAVPLKSTANREVEVLSLRGILQTDFALSIKQVDRVMEHFSEDYVREKIALIRASTNFKNGKIKNVTRYLLSALRDNYQSQHPSTKEPVALPLPQHKKIDDLTRLTQYKRFQDAELIKLFSAMPKKKQVPLLEPFEQFLQGMYLVIYARDGLKNLLVQEQLCDFLKKMNHELLTKVMPYDVWLLNEACDR